MRAGTFRKEVDGVKYQATIERRDDGSQKISFAIEAEGATPIPVNEWSSVGALCEMFKKEISFI